MTKKYESKLMELTCDELHKVAHIKRFLEMWCGQSVTDKGCLYV